MQNNITTLIFDFDGTIVDIMAEKDMIVTIFNRISEKSGSKKIEEKDIELIRGLETKELIKHLNIPLLKLPLLVRSFKEEAKRNIKILKPVSGISSQIKKLHENKYRLGILTSNDKPHVVKFLKMHNLDQYYSFIYSGSNIFGKDKVMKKMLKEQGLNSTEIVYFGDETRDIIASKKAGFRVMAVTWGLNNRQILEKYEPEFIVNNPNEILENLQK